MSKHVALMVWAKCKQQQQQPTGLKAPPTPVFIKLLIVKSHDCSFNFQTWFWSALAWVSHYGMSELSAVIAKKTLMVRRCRLNTSG